MFIEINNLTLINSNIIDKIEKDNQEKSPVLNVYLKANRSGEYQMYSKHFATKEERDNYYNYLKQHINIL